MPSHKAGHEGAGGRQSGAAARETHAPPSRGKARAPGESSDLATAAAILAVNKIPYSRLEPCGDGRRNRVFCADEKYVVRFSPEQTVPDRMSAEANLLSRLSGLIPTREVLCCGTLGHNSYQILTYLEGVCAADCWAELNSKERERVAAESADYLRSLHGISFADFGRLCISGGSHQSYCDFKISEFEETVDEIERTPDIGMSSGVLESYRRFFRERCLTCAATGAARLVHNDFWLGNVIVRGGRVAGIIDFELALKAPPVVELVKLIWFCTRPREFFKTGSYPDFMRLFRAHYPELFEVTTDIAALINLHEFSTLWQSHLFEVKMRLVSPGPVPEGLIRRSEEIIRSATKP